MPHVIMASKLFTVTANLVGQAKYVLKKVRILVFERIEKATVTAIEINVIFIS